MLYVKHTFSWRFLLHWWWYNNLIGINTFLRSSKPSCLSLQRVFFEHFRYLTFTLSMRQPYTLLQSPRRSTWTSFHDSILNFLQATSPFQDFLRLFHFIKLIITILNPLNLWIIEYRSELSIFNTGLWCSTRTLRRFTFSSFGTSPPSLRLWTSFRMFRRFINYSDIINKLNIVIVVIFESLRLNFNYNVFCLDLCGLQRHFLQSEFAILFQ